jgi:hypothetical protein
MESTRQELRYIKAFSPFDLANAVNALLKADEGWEVSGGPMDADGAFYQGIVRWVRADDA